MARTKREIMLRRIQKLEGEQERIVAWYSHDDPHWRRRLNWIRGQLNRLRFGLPRLM